MGRMDLRSDGAEGEGDATTAGSMWTCGVVSSSVLVETVCALGTRRSSRTKRYYCAIKSSGLPDLTTNLACHDF